MFCRFRRVQKLLDFPAHAATIMGLLAAAARLKAKQKSLGRDGGACGNANALWEMMQEDEPGCDKEMVETPKSSQRCFDSSFGSQMFGNVFKERKTEKGRG